MGGHNPPYGFPALFEFPHVPLPVLVVDIVAGNGLLIAKSQSGIGHDSGGEDTDLPGDLFGKFVWGPALNPGKILIVGRLQFHNVLFESAYSLFHNLPWPSLMNIFLPFGVI